MNNDETKRDYQLNELTQADLDVVAGMQIILMHAAEKCIEVIENYYAAEYMRSQDYQYYKKKFGKPQADAIVKKQVRKIFRQDEKTNVKHLLDAAQRFHYYFQNLTETSMKAVRDEVTPDKALEAIVYDSNFLCRMMLWLTNARTEENQKIDSATDIKIESMIKNYPHKRSYFSDALVERFTTNL